MPINQDRFAIESTTTIVNIAQRAKKLEAQMRSVRSHIRLAEVAIVSGYSSFTLSNIPVDYHHFAINISARSDKAASASDTLFLQINGDNGGNYQYLTTKHVASAVTYFEGTGATGHFIGDVPGATATANSMAGFSLHVYDTQSSFYKTIHSEGAMMSGLTTGLLTVYTGGGVWKNTNPITSLKLILGAGNFITGGVISLYGEP